MQNIIVMKQYRHCYCCDRTSDIMMTCVLKCTPPTFPGPAHPLAGPCDIMTCVTCSCLMSGAPGAADGDQWPQPSMSRGSGLSSEKTRTERALALSGRMLCNARARPAGRTRRSLYFYNSSIGNCQSSLKINLLKDPRAEVLSSRGAIQQFSQSQHSALELWSIKSHFLTHEASWLYTLHNAHLSKACK